MNNEGFEATYDYRIVQELDSISLKRGAVQEGT